MNSLKRAIQNLILDKSVTLSSLLVMVLTFFSIAIFSVFAFYSHYAIKYLEQSPQIFLYFTDNATEKYILEVKEKLAKSDKIASVNYTSKDNALESYIDANKENPLLLESISANIFPASLDIKATDIEYFDEIVLSIKGLEDVESVDFQKVVVDRLKEISTKSRIVGLSLISLLLTMSFLNTLLTIGMTIRSQKKEIEIMKLVGATDWFVIKPYLLQGILYAFLSSFVVGVLLFVTLPFILPQIKAFFTGVPLPQVVDALKSIGVNIGQISASTEQIIILLGLTFIIFLIGIVISIIGSLTAVAKYLRV
ncbi:MAG: permease-like cell division protein FtsX [bacterium]|nr:permease-like cell division protein FtsX [bacterium]